jgi:hypothetical protein
MSPDREGDDVDLVRRDPGTRDFWFGVIGLGACALAAIVISIISSL